MKSSPAPLDAQGPQRPQAQPTLRGGSATTGTVELEPPTKTLPPPGLPVSSLLNANSNAKQRPSAVAEPHSPPRTPPWHKDCSGSPASSSSPRSHLAPRERSFDPSLRIPPVAYRGREGPLPSARCALGEYMSLSESPSPQATSPNFPPNHARSRSPPHQSFTHPAHSPANPFPSDYDHHQAMRQFAQMRKSTTDTASPLFTIKEYDSRADRHIGRSPSPPLTMSAVRAAHHRRRRDTTSGRSRYYPGESRFPPLYTSSGYHDASNASRSPYAHEAPRYPPGPTRPAFRYADDYPPRPAYQYPGRSNHDQSPLGGYHTPPMGSSPSWGPARRPSLDEPFPPHETGVQHPRSERTLRDHHPPSTSHPRGSSGSPRGEPTPSFEPLRSMSPTPALDLDRQGDTPAHPETKTPPMETEQVVAHLQAIAEKMGYTITPKSNDASRPSSSQSPTSSTSTSENGSRGRSTSPAKPRSIVNKSGRRASFAPIVPSRKTGQHKSKVNRAGTWTLRKRLIFVDKLLTAGYKNLCLVDLANELGLKKKQLVNQLTPGRTGSIRELCLNAAARLLDHCGECKKKQKHAKIKADAEGLAEYLADGADSTAPPAAKSDEADEEDELMLEGEDEIDSLVSCAHEMCVEGDGDVHMADEEKPDGGEKKIERGEQKVDRGEKKAECSEKKLAAES